MRNIYTFLTIKKTKGSQKVHDLSLMDSVSHYLLSEHELTEHGPLIMRTLKFLCLNFRHDNCRLLVENYEPTDTGDRDRVSIHTVWEILFPSVGNAHPLSSLINLSGKKLRSSEKID